MYFTKLTKFITTKELMPRPAEGQTNSKGGSKAATERLMSELKAIMKSDPEKQGYR